MEYYVFVTKDCNLKCSYCSGVNILRYAVRKTLTRPHDIRYNIERLIQDISSQQDDHNLIVFYGGEPLLNQEDIEVIIKAVKNKGLNAKYAMYTNGILLNETSDYLIKNLHYLFVSLDGKEEIHDLHRGKGTHKRILKNYLQIREKFQGETMARTTLTYDLNLAEAVFVNLPFFDHIYWALDSTNAIPSYPQKVIDNYTDSVKILMDYWLQNVRKGIVKNIIPFQSVASSFLNNEKHINLRCGCGTKLKVMDLDGRFYLCDELLGNRKFLVNGHFPHLNNIRRRCSGCEYEMICGGRCLVSLLFHSKDKFDLDCAMTKILIQSVSDNLPELLYLIQNGVIRADDIQTYASKHCTEEIP